MNIIQQLALTAKPQDLMQSLQNCHVKGLHSIVLRNYGGRLVRCFLADKNHEMYKNLDYDFNLALGIHNHLYDLDLTRVSGKPVNISFTECPQLQNANKYEFSSIIQGGKGAEFLTKSGLQLRGIEDIKRLKIKHNELHTVYVPQGKKASWLVCEGEKVKNKTDLFQNASVDGFAPSMFSYADDVRDFINYFFEG